MPTEPPAAAEEAWTNQWPDRMVMCDTDGRQLRITRDEAAPFFLAGFLAASSAAPPPNPVTAGLVGVGHGDTSYRYLALLYNTPEAANAAHAAILAAQTPDRLEQPVAASGQPDANVEEGAGAGDSPLTLDEGLRRAMAMPPEERAAMLQRQKQGYVRAEMSWGDEGTRMARPKTELDELRSRITDLAARLDRLEGDKP